MRNQCLDEGMIQSYLDGELSPDLMEKTAAHLAACDACALTLSEAQDELDIFSAALEHDLHIPVPTESLREKINLAIAAETRNQNFTEPNRSRFAAWLSALTSSFIFKPQFAVGFATVLVAAFVGIIFLSVNKTNEGISSVGKYEGIDITFPGGIPDVTKKPAPVQTPKPVTPRNDKRGNGSAATHKVIKETTLPGEKSYLDAIASLEKAINVQDDLSTRPALLAEYQRSLAVVDKAINETQKQARKNPKDPGSAQLLYASYQSKIDLLNTVSSQNQLYASLR